jgi:environmental stress-induced protein Ves
MLYHLTEENKMISKDQVDRIVDAIEGVSTELSSDSQVRFETESYNMLAFIGENLWEIQNTLKKIEAKMK